MSLKKAITFLIGLAVLLGSQPFTVAQTGNRQPSDAKTSTSPERSPNNGLRLAQDFFRSPTKSSPFSPAANSTQPTIKTVGTNLRAFGIPFKVNAENESFIEVQLYMSRDMGQTWQFYGRQTTDRQEFQFQAQEDGQYWFSLKTLDRDRRLIPEGDPQAELKIVVDTIQPKLDFRIETDAAGRVVCRWQASDENLAPQSLQIYYQPVNESGPVKDWIKVPVNLNGSSRVGVYADQIAWWPETTEQELNVAVEIRDIADNAVQVNRRVVVPQTAWRHRSQATAQITDTQRGKLQDNWQIPADPPAAQSDPDQQMAQRSIRHRPNMICKDGVCRPAPRMQQTAVDKSDNRFPLTDGAPSRNTEPVGSEFQFANPPRPEPYGLPPRPLSGRPNASTQGSDSIIWPSDSDRWSPKNQSSVGSTMRPDPSVAPILNPTQTNPRRVTDVPSNPSTMTEYGDQVVSESSTLGIHNQYRGLASQNGSPIQKPALLPNVAGYRGPVPGADRYPDTGRPGFEQFEQARSHHIQTLQTQPAAGAGQWTQPRNNSLQQGFSNAGFANSRNLSPWETSRAPEVDVSDSPAPMQMVGSQRFRLDYGIDSIDPSGVARVDLWLTRDAGKTWNAWGNDPDNQSPFPVEVQADGLYGFRIVVHSKDGLTGQGPSSGDDADMWITVDTQSPLTRITSVPYGRTEEAGRLVINYSVSDSSLKLRPITLAFSQSPDDPWNVIEEGLRNEGRYVWKPQSNVPDRIFLRIEAVDKAGNIGVHVLSQAIDVSGLVPRGTIHGVTPVGR